RKASSPSRIASEAVMNGNRALPAPTPPGRPHLGSPPYFMIRGISDLLANKNTEGAQVDDDSQTRSTAHAAALATQLILEADDTVLRQSRGAELPTSVGNLIGYWTCDWNYASEKCQELLHIERIDALGRISGRRVSKMPKYQYVYDVSGILYRERLHLTAIPSSQSIPISVSLVVRFAGNYADSLTGIAIHPLGNPPIPKLGRNVLVYGGNFGLRFSNHLLQRRLMRCSRGGVGQPRDDRD